MPLGQKLRSITKFSCSVRNSPSAMTLLAKNVVLGLYINKKNIKNTSSLAINLKLYKVSPVHKRKFSYQFYHVSMNIDRFTKRKLVKIRGYFSIFIYFPGIIFRELGLLVVFKVNLNCKLWQAWPFQIYILGKGPNIAKCHF